VSALFVGQRVIVHRPYSGVDGWRGTVESVSPGDVLVRLDQPTTWGRLVSLSPPEVVPERSGE
jgi:hypothetical protein